MNTYKASDFARNPERVYEQARKEPVLIVRSRTNGDIKESFILAKEEAIKANTKV